MPNTKKQGLDPKISDVRSYGYQASSSPFGFTLIEMVVSLTVMSIVFLAMGSVMLMATKALPKPDAPAGLAFEAADVLRQIASELETATAVSNAQPAVIEFTVPDRNNDASDETIKYEWSGVAGEPLIRQYNGGATVPVLPAVHEFNLAYVTGTGGQPVDTNQSAEMEMSSYTAVYPANSAMSGSAAIAQAFTAVNLPPEADRWNLTRVLLLAKSQGAKLGEMSVQLREADSNGLPKTTVLEQHPIYETDLSNTYIWQDIAFSSVLDLNNDDQLCIVVKNISADPSGSIQYDFGGGAGLMTSGNGGTSWGSPSTIDQLVYYVYGTYETDTVQPAVGLLRFASIELNPGLSDATRVRTSVMVLNRPELP